MNQINVNRNVNGLKAPGIAAHPEMALLGGPTLSLNQTRVLVANYQSRQVRLADLEAFLQVRACAF